MLAHNPKLPDDVRQKYRAAVVKKELTTEGAEGTEKKYKLDWSGRVFFLPERLEQLKKWRKPRRIFLGSMCDVFHNRISSSEILRTFEAMADSPQHTYIVLTKRIVAVNDIIGDLNEHSSHSELASFIVSKHVPNLWLGVTVEHPDYLWRIEELLKLRKYAAKLYVCAEPLLGELDLTLDCDGDGICPICRKPNIKDINRGTEDDPDFETFCYECNQFCGGYLWKSDIDWVICGGETGPRARTMKPDWARGLRDQCEAAGVPFWFKQHGGKRKDRLLDGVEHNGRPE